MVEWQIYIYIYMCIYNRIVTFQLWLSHTVSTEARLQGRKSNCFCSFLFVKDRLRIKQVFPSEYPQQYDKIYKVRIQIPRLPPRYSFLTSLRTPKVKGLCDVHQQFEEAILQSPNLQAFWMSWWVPTMWSPGMMGCEYRICVGDFCWSPAPSMQKFPTINDATTNIGVFSWKGSRNGN